VTWILLYAKSLLTPGRQWRSAQKSRQNLDRDRLLNLALTRLLEIIGEAATRVPEDIRAQYSELPWLQMIAARNRLIHGYDSVDFDILWAIIKNDLPVLIAQLEKILGIEKYP
jgi:uncharacterized protein with HEPN domain